MKERLNEAFDGFYTRVLGKELSPLRKGYKDMKGALSEALDGLYAKVLGKEPSPLRITIIIIVAAFICEAVAMVILSFLPPFSMPFEALLDSTLLVILLTPVLYFLLIRPQIVDFAKRMRAEDGLRESEERYRSLSRATFEGIVFSKEGIVHDCNRQFSDMIGYGRDEMIGMDARELVFPDDRELVRSKILAGYEEPYEHGLLCKDGTVKYVEVHGQAVTVKGERFRVTALRDITGRKRSEEALEVRTRQQAVVARLGLLAVYGIGLTVLFDEAVDGLSKTLGVEYCKVLELLPDHKALILRSGVGWKEGLVGKATVSAGRDSQAGYTLLSTEPVIVKDLHDETRFSGPPLLVEHGVVSGMSVIIGNMETPFGVLGVHTSSMRVFTEDDVNFLQAVANIIAGTIQRMDYEDNIRSQVQRLSALRNIDKAICSTDELHVILSELLKQVTSQLGVDAADILLFNPETQVLEYGGGHGFRSTALQYTRLEMGKSYAGRVAQERTIISIKNLHEAYKGFRRSPLLPEEGFFAYVGVPLVAKGQVKGVLEIFHRTPINPEKEWLDFLESLAGEAAIAIENATMCNDLQKSNIELTHAYDATIEGWVRALAMRHEWTETHSQNVIDITLRINRTMGMGDDELVHVRRGALLHDIGKMAVPDSILNKPGKLTDEEWEVMRKHPVYAYKMLSPIPFLRPALDIPYCHHEKWDGKGYPRGLTGEAIPLAARIFSVADVVDALTSDRPYRPAWPLEKVKDHIHSLSGKDFDPKIVDLFLAQEL
jgi:PAS domain S-box-containing protein